MIIHHLSLKQGRSHPPFGYQQGFAPADRSASMQLKLRISRMTPASSEVDSMFL